MHVCTVAYVCTRKIVLTRVGDLFAMVAGVRGAGMNAS